MLNAYLNDWIPLWTNELSSHFERQIIIILIAYYRYRKPTQLTCVFIQKREKFWNFKVVIFLCIVLRKLTKKYYLLTWSSVVDKLLLFKHCMFNFYYYIYNNSISNIFLMKSLIQNYLSSDKKTIVGTISSVYSINI